VKFEQDELELHWGERKRNAFLWFKDQQGLAAVKVVLNGGAMGDE
jgi:hypothetical protein